MIAAVSLVTAGGVALLFAEPTESAAGTPLAAVDLPEPGPAGRAKASVEPSRAAPKAVSVTADVKTGSVAADAKAAQQLTLHNLPFRKVTTTPIRVSAAGGVLPGSDAKAPPQPVAQPSSEAETLGPQDPRWARHEGQKAATIFASVLHTGPQAPAPAEGGPLALADESSASAPPAEPPATATRVAAIEPGVQKPKAKARASEKRAPAAVAVEEPVAAPPGLAPGGRKAQVVRGANLRVRPKSGSNVLGVVPKGASVDVIGCKVWCEITYNGKRGYVYRDFVSGAGTVRKTAARGKAKSTYTMTAEEKPQEETQPQAEAAATAPQQHKQVPQFKVMSPRLQ